MTPEQRLVIRCTELEAETRGLERALDAALAHITALEAWMNEAEDTLLDLDLNANDLHVAALIERRPRRSATVPADNERDEQAYQRAKDEANDDPRR